MTDTNQAEQNSGGALLVRTFPEPVADFIRFDIQQDLAFTAIGRIRSPFAGIAEWPWLDEAMRERSKTLLEEVGEDAWREQGGTFDSRTGEPTFRRTAPAVASIVQEIATDEGGLIYTDDRGMSWAVRLLPSPGQSNDVRIGLGFSWHGSPLALDPVSREQVLELIESQPTLQPADSREITRDGLAQLANSLRLYSRAEQLLWMIYRAVREQRRSVVVLPDEALALAIWGGHARPKNWRQDIFDTLTSLSGLRVEQLAITRGGWRPRLDMHSVAVAGVQRLDPGPGGACERENCPLRGAEQRHGHFLVQIGLGFLGVLEAHARHSNGEGREYDFSVKPAGEAAQKKLKDARHAGRIVTVSMLTKLFGQAAWSELTVGQQAIVHGLVKEVTRQRKGRHRRDDGADVVQGNRVPGAKANKFVACRLLDSAVRYVAFNGNGKRRGMGYRIVGEQRRGWLAKCGYDASAGGGKLRSEVLDFLADLEVVAGIMGLAVVGYHKEGRWLDLTQIIATARGNAGIEKIEEVTLRVYGPEDYHVRLRRYFEEKGSLRLPAPGEIEDGQADDRGDSRIDVLMERAGVTQTELGEYLGCTQQFLSKVLTGKRRWPQGMLERAEAYLVAKVGQG